MERAPLRSARGLGRARARAHGPGRVTWAASGGGDPGRRWRTRRAADGRPRAALSRGGPAGRSPQSSAPAQATPGNAHIRETCGIGSEKQDGGSGLVLRGESGPRDPRDGQRWPAAAPRRLSPPCPTRDTWGPREGFRPPQRPPPPARGRCPGAPRSRAGLII